jgi:nucleoside-diphosphate-sugar epimerase
MNNIEYKQIIFNEKFSVEGDITFTKFINNPADYVKEGDIFIHLGAAGVSADEENFDLLFEYNVNRLEIILNALARTQVERVVMFGSGFEYGRSFETEAKITPNTKLDPISNYAVTKVAGFKLIDKYQSLDILYFRLFQIYGPGSNAIRLDALIAKSILENSELSLKQPTATKDFLHVCHLTNFIFSALKTDFRSKVLNVSTGEETEVQVFASSIFKACGKGSISTAVPAGGQSSPNIPIMRYRGDPSFEVFQSGLISKFSHLSQNELANCLFSCIAPHKFSDGMNNYRSNVSVLI